MPDDLTEIRLMKREQAERVVEAMEDFVVTGMAIKAEDAFTPSRIMENRRTMNEKREALINALLGASDVEVTTRQGGNA